MGETERDEPSVSPRPVAERCYVLVRLRGDTAAPHVLAVTQSSDTVGPIAMPARV